MASGTINGSTGNVDVYAKIEWSYTQNINTNSTSVTATVYIRRIDDGVWHSSGTTYITLNIAGTSKSESKYFWVGHYGTSDWFQMITNTVDVPHNADGSHAAITISCTSSGSGTTVEPISCSGTVSLPTIARASQPTATNATFGSTTTITTNRASSSFTHTITVSMGSHSQTISNVGASTTWTVPASWADTIPTATSNTLSISCVTYSGSTNIGTKTTSCTVTIPDSWKPTVTISKTLTNGGDNSQVLVNVTTVNLTANGTASTGTSISSYSWSGGTVSGTGASKTHSPTSAATFTYTVTATDRRGRTGTATVTATSESGVSSMSCSASVYFGNALPVTITRKKASFTHNVQYYINSSYTNTLTGQGTSASYTIPSSWAASIPAATSVNMTVTVTTYNGSSSLGSVNKTVSVVVPSSWVPSFTLTTEAVSAFNSLYLKGVSKVKLTASSVSASTGSQIQSYSFSGNNMNKSATTTATSYNVTSDILSVVGSNTYTVKVTDKRGRVTTKTSTITVTDYAAPTLNLSVGRYTSGGVADNFGGYGRMTATGTYSAVSGNTWTLTLKQKKRSASSYTTVNTYSNQTGTISKTSSLFTADVDSVYDCQAVLTDAVGKSVTKNVAISTGRPIRDFFKDKVVTFFSTASEALRQTFGSPDSLLFSNAAGTYLNGHVYVPQYKSADGLTDGWRRLNLPYIFTQSSGGGNAGYFRLCRLTISSTYQNSPIEIDITRRPDKVSATIIIKFQNANSADPELYNFGYIGPIPYFYMVKAQTSTWDLYVQKGETWDSICVNNIKWPAHDSGIKIEWTSDYVTSLPTGAIAAVNYTHVKTRGVRVYMPTPTTVPDLIAELRYSNGAMGSLYVGTDYTSDSVTIGTGWYNYIYIPHREGGLDGQANGDNCNYGNLLLLGMTVAARYLVRCYGGSINGVWDLHELVRGADSRSWHKQRDGSIVRMTSAPATNGVASGMTLKTVDGTWDIATGGSSVTNANLLYFIYCTDANYSSNTNSTKNYYLNPDNGYMNISCATANTANALAKTTFSVSNSSSSYGSITSQRCVKMGNMVILEIWYSFKDTASASAQTTILTVPSGYRPLANHYCGLGGTNLPAVSFAVVSTAGNIQVPAQVINTHGAIMINAVYDV